MQYKAGTLSNYNKGWVRVVIEELDNLETPWIPLMVGNAGADSSGSPIDFGVQVGVLMDDNFETGCCLGCIPSDISDYPESNRDKKFHHFSDGTKIEYDRTAKKLSLDLADSMDLKAITIMINGTNFLEWVNNHVHGNGNDGANTTAPTTTI